MGLKNRIVPGDLYFLTMTVVDWVDIFTRPVYKHIVVDALRFCQEKKGLKLYAWVLMSNHLHMIAAAEEGKNLSDLLRDFKGYTSRKIVATVQEEPESRKQWLLHRFEFNAKLNPKVRHYKVWQEGNEVKEIYSNGFLDQKLEYLHQNPVRAEWVNEPQHYRYSSASNYADTGGLLQVELLE
ncbi:REP-associated tyrosine transposase [Pontibacter chinhatensis]|uniref:REP element-mobilizing transposase RayT n=1 Tax=Pontibacter chinhatensis TaxID=1436961 RepID=A0A1I2VAE6_9BACT|nr:transposase [Pontibacter chinhatensis]SFG86140.1 REP element-mobilizing transposase RayT [Pontibacter chinhatensis]